MGPPRDAVMVFAKHEIEPLLWQLYMQAVTTHDGKRATQREAQYAMPEGLSKAEAAEFAQSQAPQESAHTKGPCGTCERLSLCMNWCTCCCCSCCCRRR